MNAGLQARILARYPHASAIRRWHMRGRLRLCPYDTLLDHLTPGGALLDIGCGFGHLAWYLAEARPSLLYFGCDIDSGKVEMAQKSLAAGESGAAGAPVFRGGSAMEIADWPPHFQNILLLDVLYLMPWDLQTRILAWALSRLAAGCESRLIIKVMDMERGPRTWAAMAQEFVMVRLLRGTRHSGTLSGGRPLADYREFARRRGWDCVTETLPQFNPSAILRFQRRA